MSEELKTILQGAIWKELEMYFTAKADEIEKRKINRLKTYAEQGIESHVNELSAQALRDVIHQIGSELGIYQVKKITYK